MTWDPNAPQGNESAKVRFDVLPYASRGGIDLGCGPRKIYSSFIGVDNGLDTKLFNIPVRAELMVKSCERLPMFADQSWWCVFSSHLLEHIVDYKGALAEWWRLVKEGGTLVLYLPHADLYPNIGQEGANPDHKHDFRNADITAAMREVAADWALEVDEVRDYGIEYGFLQVYRKRAPGAGILDAIAARPEKTAGIVRPGAYGDALWGSSVAAQLKEQGYHVTVYTGRAGMEVLAHDPNIDRLVELPSSEALEWSDDDWLGFYLWESRKYDRWHNLIGVVEGTLLPHPENLSYHWPVKVRQKRMRVNYLEAIHDLCELPHVFNQRFYPTPDEQAWAVQQRKEHLPGPLVVIAPTGSGLPKTWPHVQRFMDLLAEREIYSVMVGEVREELEEKTRFHCVLGKDVPIRTAMALALTADAVVGTESAIVNAVAMEPMPKVVLLSHSAPENLTKHWMSTIAVEATGLPCHPCHRLHVDFTFCTRDSSTGFAACQAAVSAETIFGALEPYLEQRRAVLQARAA